MLNVKKLSELLARNIDARLYPRMFVMSPNGTLLAYSRPVDIKELRDQAALVSMAWKEHELILSQGQDQSQHESTPADDRISIRNLETLTIEFESNSLIVRAVQPNLLLVVVGAVIPGSKPAFKITAERYGDERYPTTEPSRPGSRINTIIGQSLDDQRVSSLISPQHDSNVQLSKSPAGSHMSQRDKDVQVGLLHIQRKKLDAISDYLRAELDARGFIMPDDGSFP